MTVHVPTERLAYTPVEAAQKIGVGVSTLYRWMESEKIRTVKLGNCRRVTHAELLRILEEGV